MQAQLAKEIQLNQLGPYLSHEDWWLEQKLDGIRLLVEFDHGKCVGVYNRKGEPSSKVGKDKFGQAALWVPTLTKIGTTVFDGEYMMNNTYYAFDLLLLNDADATFSPLSERKEALRILLHDRHSNSKICPIPQARSDTNKLKLFKTVCQINGEGVVLKNRNAVYKMGQETTDMLKIKFTKTIDVFVTGVGIDGKNNCAVSVADPNDPRQWTEVSHVSLNGKPAVERGDVIEVRYLYVGEDNRLVQPRLVRVRDDKAWWECGSNQTDGNHKSDVVIRSAYDDFYA